MSGRTGRPRAAVWALALALGVGGCAGETAGRGGGASGPPEGARDPLNPAVRIERGTFTAGSEDWRAGYPEGSPYSKEDEKARRWTVPTFWIQRHEVTNREYARFDTAHAFAPGRERHPVVGITWSEAMAYARSRGGRLPNEVEWEFAARGTGGREYPWGEAEPTCERAHFDGCDPRGSLPVMSRPRGATPRGVHDLAGNVWEWVMPVWFEPGETPVNRNAIRLRGGSFAEDPFFLRAANRSEDHPPELTLDRIGFRVAWPSRDGGG